MGIVTANLGGADHTVCGWRVGMVTAKQGGADHKRGGQVGIVTAKLGGADHNRRADWHSYSQARRR